MNDYHVSLFEFGDVDAVRQLCLEHRIHVRNFDRHGKFLQIHCDSTSAHKVQSFEGVEHVTVD
jgi:hypothetical protein